MAYHALKKYREAVVDFTEALRINPANVQAYGHRAEAYDALGEIDKARRDRRKAARLRK